MKKTPAQQSTYAFGHSEEELERLSRQAQVFEPFTRQLLQQAGLSTGMRVLDVVAAVETWRFWPPAS